ncbi:hypothetical protein [Croceicoccus sp. Ery15]|uniref:hypothetical protein n=1 Tax=Croceicoccus sp. Ery15 TaxID=1703338 RepID=UPI001E64E97A|nr:hypothetical protein [Croceicoccus sp. Ery15]
MIGERRRPVIDRDLVVRATLAWLLMAALLVIAGLPAIMGRQFSEGDDIMRLLEVRDWLAGQSWFDVSQYRIDAPFGAGMHWSRLVDVPLAAVIVVLSPLFGQALAEHVASVIVPLGTLWLAVLLIGRIAWRLCDEEATGLACLAAAIAAPLLHQMRPMRIDHHGWQIVLFMLAVNALMARDARRGGWILGGALALWLNISMEALPMVAVFGAILFARWLRCWGDRQWLVAMLQSLAACSAGLYLLTRGTTPSLPMCDAMAPAHIAALSIMAIAATGLGRIEVPRPWMFMVLVLGSGALAGVIVLLQMAPQCAGGSFAGMDPVAHDVWLANVIESKPLWHHPVTLIAQILVPTAIAIVVSLRLAARSADWLHRWHLEYTVLLLAALVLAVFLPRSSGLVAGLAAVPIGMQMKQWLRQLRSLGRPGKQAMAVAGMTASLLPAMPLTVLMHATPSHASAAKAAPAIASACDVSGVLPSLGEDAANIMAPIDMGPAILIDSPHRVVATAHHRAHRGIGDTIRSFSGPASDAHAILMKRRVGFVMLCPEISEVRFYRNMGHDNLASILTAGETPDWLMPITHDGDQGVLVWRVIG